jgi:hypothetical protein
MDGMKIFLRLLIIFLLVFVNKINAQIRIGIKGGINLSTLYQPDAPIDLGAFRSGYHAGAYIKANIFRWLAIQPEILYNTKGRYGNMIRYEMEYVDIPVLAVVNFTRRFNIHIGPYGSYLTDGRVFQNIFNGQIIQDNDFNRRSFKQFDYGLAAGLAIEFHRLNLGLRYNYGARDVLNDIGFTTKSFHLKEGRNSLWQVYLGFNIF